MITKTKGICQHHTDPHRFGPGKGRPVTCWCTVEAKRQLSTGEWACESLEGKGTKDLMLLQPNQLLNP